MIELSITILELDRIAAAIERLTLIQSAARFTFKLNFGDNLMPVYKSDKPDFTFNIIITAADSEGNPIPDAPIPTGFTLTVTSDNPAAFSVVQDPTNPKSVAAHVGSPGQANVVANLMDPAGNLVATGGALVTVVVGDPAQITAINLNLPE
jgi:hypothetical protein